MTAKRYWLCGCCTNSRSEQIEWTKATKVAQCSAYTNKLYPHNLKSAKNVTKINNTIDQTADFGNIFSSSNPNPIHVDHSWHWRDR